MEIKRRKARRMKEKSTGGACVKRMCGRRHLTCNHSAWTLFIIMLLATALCVMTGCSNKETEDIEKAETEIVEAEALETPVATEEPDALSEEDANKMLELVSAVQQLNEQGADAAEISDYLSSLDCVESMSMLDGNRISCLTEFGITAVWSEASEEFISGASSTKYSTDEGLELVEQFAEEGLHIVILCPYASADDSFLLDEYEAVADSIVEKISGSVTVLKDEEVDLDSLKHLDDYDMVFFYSHGGIISLTRSPWSYKEDALYTMTGEYADTAESYISLYSDFSNGRIVVDLSTGRIGVSEAFYEYYYEENALQDMFFHYGSCNSMYVETLSDTLISLGAAWVEGWSGQVTYDEDLAYLEEMMTNLASGYSAAESAEMVRDSGVVEEFTQEDCEFVVRGDGTYQIAEAEETAAPEPITVDLDNLVTDAFNKTVNSMSFVIPQINIDSSDVESINQEIWAALYTCVAERLINSNENGIEYISYDWYVNNDILSLVIECDPYGVDTREYYVYNVDITTGEELTKDEFISSYGMSESDYFESVRKALYSDNYDVYEEFCAYVGVDYVNEQLSKTISDNNVKAARPFINGNGKLCVVASIYSLAGADSYYRIVTVTDHEVNVNYPSLFGETQDTSADEETTADITEEETSVTYSEEDSWKEVYIDYINSDDSLIFAYALIYLDDDDIPELYLSGATELDGDRICTIGADGNIEVLNISMIGGTSYIERSGIFCNFNGSFLVYSLSFYQLENGEFKMLDDHGMQTDAFDDSGETVSSYKWNDVEVTEEEFYSNWDAIIDTDEMIDLFLVSTDASNIIEDIQNS